MIFFANFRHHALTYLDEIIRLDKYKVVKKAALIFVTQFDDAKSEKMKFQLKMLYKSLT